MKETTEAELYPSLTRVSCLRAKDSMFPAFRPGEDAAYPGDDAGNRWQRLITFIRPQRLMGNVGRPVTKEKLRNVL